MAKRIRPPFPQQQQRHQQQQQGCLTLRRTIQGAIFVTSAISYLLVQVLDSPTAPDRFLLQNNYNEPHYNFKRSLASLQEYTEESHLRALQTFTKQDLLKEKVLVPTAVNTATPNHVEHNITLSPLDEFLEHSIVNEAGKATVHSYIKTDKEPLRHLRFSDLILPEVPKNDPVMKTAYLESTVVSQSPWFQHQKICNDTCCAQQVAISMKQDETRIINAVDGQDVADVLLFGHSLSPLHKFAASELTEEMIPCLQPGVIIHADSYRGPITRFFQEFRPKMTVPYVLVTTKTDGDSPIKFFTQKLDTDPLLLAWYGINPSYALGANHSKFQMMPLGLTGNRYRQQPDMNLLMKARNYTNPFGGDKSRWTNVTMWLTAEDTTPLVFVKFGIHENALHRDVPWNMACNNRTMGPLDNVSCNKQIGVNPRQTYAAASKYLFGLSPPGNGVDCFRTYELLLNGVIPIVEAQPEYDELFKDLPVVQLNHWNYTQKELIKVLRDYIFSTEFLNNDFQKGWERLFLRYWRNKVLTDAGRLNETIQDPEGNEYYTAWQYTLNKPPFIQHAIPEQVEANKKKEQEKKKKKAQKQAKGEKKNEKPPRRPTPPNLKKEAEEKLRKNEQAKPNQEIRRVMHEIEDARKGQLKKDEKRPGRQRPNLKRETEEKRRKREQAKHNQEIRRIMHEIEEAREEQAKIQRKQK